jgi:hypothetical protein
MPRLSLYKPEKGNDFKFIDKQVYEMFQVGGTDVLVHKYIGPIDPTDPNKAMGESTIQDVLFLENRDRKYDTSIYPLRGVYNVNDIDFNLSQFGLFLQNDTIFMTVHINNTVDTLGRKIITGDVIELPHLVDHYALGNLAYALKRFYVVEDVNRAAEGFSATWWPHLYRLKLKPLVDSQEYKDIFMTPVNSDMFAGEYDETKHYCIGQIVRDKGVLYEVIAETTGNEPPNSTYFRPLDPNEVTGSGMSDYLKILAINEAVVAEAESDSPLSGYETSQFWTLSVDPNSGNVNLETVDQDTLAIDDANTTDATMVSPVKDGYRGFLLGDGIAPNGAPYGFGIKFPDNAARGDFYLRTDYYPNRLFRFSGKRWVKYEEKVRHTMTNNDVRQTQKTGFINNTEQSNIGMLQMDVFTIEDPKVFRPTDPTASFDLIGKKIVTKVPYVSTYGVEVWIGESKNPVTSIFEEDGCIAFTMQYSLNVGGELRWTVFKETIKQKQSLSRALRPRADF